MRVAPRWHVTSPYIPASEVLRLAEWQIVEAAARREPFFLFLNFMDAHSPYILEPPFRDRFPGRDERYVGWELLGDLYKRLYSGKLAITARERAHLESQYDGGIAFIDATIGRLLRYLREADSLDDALIIVTADHGEAFGDRGLLEHATSVYQDQIHIPLIIHFPRQRQPSVVSTIASSIDLLPTILATAGVVVPRYAAGEVLTPADSTTQRHVMSESFASVWLADGKPAVREQKALFASGLKLIVTANARPELFRPTRDPNELSDVSSSEPAVVTDLIARLSRLVSDARLLRRDDVRPQHLDPDAIRRLKSLGYLR